MQFAKCLTCPDIKGRKCAGPNYMAMSSRELVEWITEYQRINKITNAQLAQASDIPKGTIDGLKYRVDVRHDTIYRLLKALIELSGGVWGGEPCSAASADVLAQVETIRALEDENARFSQDLERSQQAALQMETEVQRVKTRVQRLSLVCAGLAGLTFLLLITDWLFPGVGFIWG